MSAVESILNVDDYDPGRYARTKVLRLAGFSVLEARTGEETLRIAAEHRPTLILLDVNLPDMSGFEVCRRLRESPETSAATIVHFSASSIQSHHLVSGLEGGADTYLVEPVDPSVLVATIHAFLRARRAEEALRRSNAELEWFAHRAAHDLKEPLRTIAIQAELLKQDLKGSVEPGIQTSLQFVMDAAQRMASLIDGLLCFARVNYGGNAAEVDGEALFAEVCESLQGAIRDSGARITHGKLPIIVAEPGLEEVFQNLIANAIKYRREHIPPQIHVSAQAEAGSWRFSIQDNGIGIEPGPHREAIFKIFTRLHGQSIPGSGIGLALARKIVETQGGRIWVESEPGAGSTFHFTIPKDARSLRK